MILQLLASILTLIYLGIMLLLCYHTPPEKNTVMGNKQSTQEEPDTSNAHRQQSALEHPQPLVQHIELLNDDDHTFIMSEHEHKRYLKWVKNPISDMDYIYFNDKKSDQLFLRRENKYIYIRQPNEQVIPETPKVILMNDEYELANKREAFPNHMYDIYWDGARYHDEDLVERNNVFTIISRVSRDPKEVFRDPKVIQLFNECTRHRQEERVRNYNEFIENVMKQNKSYTFEEGSWEEAYLYSHGLIGKITDDNLFLNQPMVGPSHIVMCFVHILTPNAMNDYYGRRFIYMPNVIGFEHVDGCMTYEDPIPNTKIKID